MDLFVERFGDFPIFLDNLGYFGLVGFLPLLPPRVGVMFVSHDAM